MNHKIKPFAKIKTLILITVFTLLISHFTLLSCSSQNNTVNSSYHLCSLPDELKNF